MTALAADDPALARVAVVGIGRWGKRLVDTFSRVGAVVVCCNRSNEDDRAWVRNHHPATEVTTDLQHVLEDPRVGTVVVATPTWTHASLTAAALDAGKHVFVEKPLATSSHEAAELVERARQRGRRLFVDHTYLFEPALETLVDLVRSDPVEHATLHWQKLGTFDEDLHWNLLSHDAAIALSLFGEPASASEVVERRGIVSSTDVLAVQLRFGSRRCRLEIDRCMPRRTKTVRVLTQSGRVLLWEEGGLWELGPDRIFDQIFATSLAPLARAVSCFVEGSRGGDELLPVRAVELVEDVAAEPVAG
jgi:predicted dehydrogenase